MTKFRPNSTSRKFYIYARAPVCVRGRPAPELVLIVPCGVPPPLESRFFERGVWVSEFFLVGVALARTRADFERPAVEFLMAAEAYRKELPLLHSAFVGVVSAVR